jgi:hypothetical protein
MKLDFEKADIFWDVADETKTVLESEVVVEVISWIRLSRP